MRRREFIGGLAAAWPLAARGQQQADRMRRIGVLMASAADDSDSQARIAGLLQGLQQLGWVDGRNVRIDIRWATTNPDEIRKHAAELVATAPEVVVRSEEHTSELQSRQYLVCRLLLEKKKKK